MVKIRTHDINLDGATGSQVIKVVSGGVVWSTIEQADVNGLVTALSGKADTSALADYVLTTALTSTLAGYVTTDGLTTALGAYTTTTDLNTALNLKANTSSLSTVATTGAYNDLTGKPTLFSGAYADLTGKPTYATVATTGSFESLTDVPTTLSGYGITDAVASDLLGANNGVATLGADGKVPTSQLNPLAITSVFTAVDETAMLALTTEEGDVVIRTDESKTYIRNSGTADDMTDFNEILTPGSGVSSVNGQTGVVTLTATDIGLGNVDNTSDANKPVSTATQTALNLKANLANPTFTGTVTVPAPTNNTDASTKKYVDDLIAAIPAAAADEATITAIGGAGNKLAVRGGTTGQVLLSTGSSSDATWTSLAISNVTGLQTALEAKASDADLTTLEGTVSTLSTTVGGKLDAIDAVTTLDGLDDVTLDTPEENQVLQYISGEWVNSTFEAGASSIATLSDVQLTDLANGEVLKYNSTGSKWENITLATVATTGSYNDLGGRPNLSVYALQTDLTDGLALKANTTDLSAVATGGTLDDLTDVTISGETGPLDGQVLAWDSDTSQWVNSVIISEGAAFFTEITATGTGASQDITLPHAGYTDDLIFVTVNGLVLPTGQYSISGTTLTLTTNAAGDDISVRAVQIGAGTLSALIPSVMNDLSDVAITSPTANQVLKYDGSNWINAAAPATVSTLNDLTDVTIGTLATGNILQYNGSDWVNVAMGPSLPNGGTVGQVLAKNSGTDGDASWANANIVPLTANATTAYTLVLADVYVRSTSSSATAITVPTNATVAYPLGTQISIVQAGTGQITITPAGGVTINKASPATLVSRTQFSVLTLTKVGTNEWDLAGDMVLS